MLPPFHTPINPGIHPSNPKVRNTRTHWIRGFIAFQLGRVPFQAVRGAAAERDFMGE
jgi:hypothetical protein